MHFNVGDRLDRYVIEAMIGEGGMGRVYRAHDTRLYRRVALKVVRLEPSDDANASADAASRLLREARAAAALDHPNAISVFDVGEVDDTLFIAMELVSGKTLRAYVGDEKVAWETKLRWLLDTARALSAAHARGLVHRDVKPENILVRDDGVVKVLDFGIAKRLVVDVDAPVGNVTVDGLAPTQTIGGPIVGTPRYLSPEQVRIEPVDARADQFSWGVVAYELLAGRLPWGDQTSAVQLLLAILGRAPDPLGKYAPHLPTLVEATIMKTLAKNPVERFASIDDVVRALEPFVLGLPRRSVGDIVIAPTRTDPAPPMPAPSTSSPTLTRSRSRTAAAIGGLALAIAGAFTVARWTDRTPAPPSTSASGVSAAPGPTALTDLPLPTSAVEAARAEFKAYLQSFRDADFDAARQSLERAVGADPAMGAAHLRLAFMQSLVSSDESLVRSTFKRALQFRGTMSDRDRALLDAFEPYYQREPSDPLLCEMRLEALASRFPLDAEVAYMLGSVRYDRGALARAVEAFDRAIFIDPKFAQAWSAKGGCQAYLGRFDESFKSLDEALRISSTATEAFWYRAQIHEQEGKCEKEEADVRAWLSRDPDDYYAYQWLAKALFAEKHPLETVRTALEQKWARLEAARRPKLEAIDRALLDVVSGDFASAEKRALDLEAQLAAEPGALAHAQTHLLLMQIYDETGRPKDARRIAESYLARRDAWATPHRVDDRAIWEDPVPAMLGTLAHTGGLTPDELEAKREAWLGAWRAKTSEAYVNYLWIYAYALPTGTAAEAKNALDALSKFSPLPAFTPMSVASAHVGNVFLQAGRFEEAIVPLGRAVASCIALQEPASHTRASLRLGIAREALGQTEGACAAYRLVLDRWGHARPRSISADEARRRAAALGCR
jgi:serine/threonine-protein kinase